MSTALVSSFYDHLGETFGKNNGYTSHKSHLKVSERKSVPNFTIRRTSTPTNSLRIGGPTSKSGASSVFDGALIAITSEAATVLSLNNHRKLDRSLSEPADRTSANLRSPPANSSRYKTELCRPYEESGKCKYGDKCQFAHGAHELRTLARHPKYKTELCRTFHTIGFCPYGPRCHFIHNADSVDARRETPADGFYDDRAAFAPTAQSPGAASANNAFTFNSDFSQLVKRQNAYNTALNTFMREQRGNLNIMNNDSDSVFSTGSLSPPNPPSSPPSSSTGSEMDELSVCGSPPDNPLRLPIFSRLSTSDD